MNLTVGLAQIASQLGDVTANVDQHLESIAAAAEQEVGLLIFPELSLTGYQLYDLAFEVAMRPSERDPHFSRLLAASSQMDLVVGFVEVTSRQEYYIASAYLAGGEVRHLHRKLYLPTYGMFDEGRFFGRGNAVRAFDTRYGRVGMLICEDFWHLSAPYLLWLDGADLLLFSSASPGKGLSTADKPASAHSVDQLNSVYAGNFTSFVMHCNRVGVEDGVSFYGGSTVFDPDGRLIAQGPYYEEALVTATLDFNQLRRSRIRLPLLRDERHDLTLREMARIVNDQM